ncbi:MAG: carboxylate-amine ligase [Hyphomicrobiaceae bacterium]|nr:MAG: carboxylate-amine ligase [Hyphomicrobiaceae bacterium]
MKDPSFTIGIEEEYHLVDLATRDLVPAPPELMADCETELGDQVHPEFLRSQIEVGTRICRNFAEAAGELRRLRATVARLAAKYGLAPIAAGTHPFGRPTAIQPSDKERYQSIARDLQLVVRRLATCGMHVHVGIEDDELRIDLMNQARYFLPHLLALSTSSPFWEGADSGLKCYRLAVYNELPRTGLPGRFSGWQEYEQTIGVLVRSGVIEDPSKIWWDLRPSARFPTLEMRITDVCTRLDDAITIAALYVAIVRMLYRLRRSNQSWRTYPLLLLDENRWRAQRYGVSGTLFDFGRGELIAFAALLEELIALVAEDAVALACVAEIDRARAIAAGGTSADRQIACFKEASLGADTQSGLRSVVDWLVTETRAGPEPPAPGSGSLPNRD